MLSARHSRRQSSVKGGGEHPSPRTMRDLKRMDVLPDGDWLHREFAIVPLYHTEYEGTNTTTRNSNGAMLWQ